ncbi:MAG: SPOR domain-containing protein [Gammaproteobacteria bacterium]
MNRRLKERLTGAAVLVMLAVIFIPMVLDNSNENNARITRTNIPPKPNANLKSRIIPIEEPLTIEKLSQDIIPVEIEQDIQIMEKNNEISPAEIKSELADTVINQVRSVEVDEELIEVEKVTNQIVELDTRDLTAWVVQLGSFSSQTNAENLILNLQSEGYPAYIEEITVETGSVFRVRVGPEISKSSAETTLSELDEKFSLKGILLQYP